MSWPAGDPAAVAEVQHRAEALRYLSKKAKLAISAVNAAARLKTDAQWHAGRLLREAEKNKGGRPAENPSQDVTGSPLSYHDMGISRMLREAKAAGEYGQGKPPMMGGFTEVSQSQLHRWQDMSRVDRGEVDRYYKSQEEKQAEITSSAIAHMGALAPPAAAALAAGPGAARLRRRIRRGHHRVP
jgi:hypothetical protein